MHRPTPSTIFFRAGRTGVCGIVLVCLLAGFPGLALPSSGNRAFPLYPVIENNVRFWKDIYTKYSLTSAVIHDKNDLSIVYEVVPIVDERLPGAKKANKHLIDSKKDHYAAILRKLSRTAPRTAEERRIAALFPARGTARKMAVAAESIRAQTGQKERFLEGVVRSGAYLPAIKKVFRSYNLPEELAYLPHVESSFNTKAYSKLGASGVWQFTHSTGKQYLRIDAAVDERGDPILAAHAAAKYLRHSYDLLGTWPLALTSYNYGTGGMKRALSDKGSYERIFSEYCQGHFKFASRNFYSEFLAALQAAKEFEGSAAVRMDRPEPTRSLTLKGKATAREVAKRFGVSPATLQRLNPALRQPVFDGQRHIPRGYTLRLPSTGQKTEPEPVVAATRTVSGQNDGSSGHTVKKGETIGGLARRYRISPKTLTAANELRGGVIRIGQTLRIPPADSPAAPVAAQPLSPDPQTEAAAPSSTPSDSRYDVFQTTTHNGKRYGKIRIQPGETLQLLAEWAALSPASLRRINSMGANEAVHSGRQLVLLLNKVSPGEFRRKRLSHHQRLEREYFSAYSIVGIKKYTVASDDTVWNICHSKFAIPIWLLQKYNTSKDLTKLRSSMELVIPIVKAI